MAGRETYTRQVTRTTIQQKTMRCAHQKRLQWLMHLRFLDDLPTGAAACS